MADKPQNPAVLPVPRWLSRAEKAAFRRICEQISAAGRPLSAADVDPISDLVSLRSRIADTRRIYRYAVDSLKRNPAWRSDQALALATSRQLDAQTLKAHKMAAAIGLAREEMP
ncbi:hypothetical protein P9272_31395 [Mesorhizobium sp. WSM4976]|uniref:hypothetical protein n=1 Tax=Mesorhizobium sp. WSM4976 TaxID=3038549 RepID=UPI002417529D|nr:hypothetical protein [Mesorhizobium sp. WSM4976]MDG4898049.1 hypothetical protein [Mesorhizobium sp. WSM4976]